LEPRRILSVVAGDLLSSSVAPFGEPVGGAGSEAALVAEEAIVNRQVASDLGVQQMPSIAVDPLDADHLVVAYMDHSLVPTSGYAGIGVSVSQDAGDSWQQMSIPLPEEFDQGAANPIVRFDDQGHVYVSFMAATFLGETPALTNPDVFNPERNASDREFGFQSNNGIFVARSDDGGMNWNDPTTVVSQQYEDQEVFFEILPDLAIDTFPELRDGQSNPNYGNLYVVWSRLYTTGQFPGRPEIDGGIDIMLAVSGDGGVSWESQLQETWIDANGDGTRQNGEVFQATVIQEPLNTSGIPGLGHVDQSHVTVGRGGDVYVSHYGSGDFAVHHSADGGANFTSPDHETGEWIAFGTGLDTFVQIEGLPNNRFRTQVVRAIVADPVREDTLYAVEPDLSIDPLGNEVDPADVLFGRSGDNGKTWETSFRLGPNDADVLNDDNDGQLAEGPRPDEVVSGQAMARLAIDSQGNIGVIWYDSRRDPAGHLLDVFGTVSIDGGETFSPNFRITDVSFDAKGGVFLDALGRENYCLGDFIGLAMNNGTAYAAWTDTRLGNQDIFFARFPIDPAPTSPKDRFEPNQTHPAATDLGRVVQRLVPKLAADPGDEDWFRLEAVATGELIVAAVPDDRGALLLELWDETGTTQLARGVSVTDEAGNIIEYECRIASDAGQALLVRVLASDVGETDADGVPYSLRLQSLTADLGRRALAAINGTIASGDGALYKVEAAAAGSLEVELLAGDNVLGDLDLQILDLESLTVMASGQPLAGPSSTVVSAEPNDSIAQANATELVGVGSVAIDGFIGDGEFGLSTGDYDFYRIEAGASQRIRVDLDPLGSGLDGMIGLFDGSGKLVEVVDSGGASDSESTTFQTEAPGTYFVAATAWFSGFSGDPNAPGTGAGAGSTGAYRLSIGTKTVGPGAIKQATLPIQKGDAVLLLAGSLDGSQGDFTLRVTNRDQFTTPESRTLFFPAGAGPSQAAMDDLDADGNLDVVVSNTLSDTISVLLGNGNGTFQSPRQFPVGAYVAPRGDVGSHLPTFRRSVAVADLDGDNVPDVTVTNFASSDVSVLLGRGDGTFEPGRRFDATATPYDLAVGDLNGDGLPDQVVVDTSEQVDASAGKAMITAALLFGRGDGTFTPQRSEQVSAGEIFPATAVEIADLDGDGNNDLVISGQVHFNVSVLMGIGDGTFAPGMDFEAERLGAGLVVADVDGDDVLDIVNVGFEQNMASVLRGNGDGTFERVQRIFTGQGPVAVEVADFGSQIELADSSIGLGPPDGKPDLLVANSGVQLGFQAVGVPGVVVLPGIFDFDDGGDFVLFGPPLELAAAEAPHDLDLGDVNGDGVLDVTVVDRHGVLIIFGEPPDIVTNDTPETARDLGTVVHLVDQTQTIVPGRENAYFRLAVPTEAVDGAGDEIIDFSAGFEAIEGPGLQMEVFDSDGNRLAAGERFRIRAAQGEELLLHVFGVEGSDTSRGSGAYTLAIDVLPQVVSVDAQALLPGDGASGPGGPTTSLVITLQGDRLDLTTAEDPNHYTVTHLGLDGTFGTADDRVIPIGDAGIEQSIVYNAGANVEVSTGLSYPTAVRQTLTLVFVEPLPAGSYEIELSSAIQTAAFNESERQQLADPGNFTGHPVVSFRNGQIEEGARVEAVDLVLQAGQLGDLSAFETGTPFLTQLHNDLGALLDAILSKIGDDPSVTDSILDQIMARLDPSLGEFGQRPAEMLVIFLDPVTFSLWDPAGNRAIRDLQTNTMLSNIPSTSVGVWGNVELVIVPVTFGTYELDLADVPARARGAVLFFGSDRNEIRELTSDIRAGIDHFTFNFGSSSLSQVDWNAFQTSHSGDLLPSGAPAINKMSSIGAAIRSPGDPLPVGKAGASFDQGLGAGGPSEVMKEFLALAGTNRLVDLREFIGWKRLRMKGPVFIDNLFDRVNRNLDGYLDYDEFVLAYQELTNQLAARVDRPPAENTDDNRQGRETIDDPSDNPEEASVSLPTKVIMVAFDAVHAVDFAKLRPAPSSKARTADLAPNDSSVIDAAAEAPQPTPEGLLANLTGLLGFLWNLLALGMGG